MAAKRSRSVFEMAWVFLKKDNKLFGRRNIVIFFNDMLNISLRQAALDQYRCVQRAFF
jgi:hypothetical protein